MQLPADTGMWPASWTVGDPAQGEWLITGEIDIAEYFGDTPNTMNAFLHYGKPPKGADINFGGRTASTDVTRWHGYALDGNTSANGYLKWSVDNDVFREETPASMAAEGYPWLRDSLTKHLQSVIVNLAVGGAGGTPPAGAFARQMKVNYIHVYEKPKL